jgi:hypothetical protein
LGLGYREIIFDSDQHLLEMNIILTDLINELRGNSSVNTVQQANDRGSWVFCRSVRRSNRLAG